jgi:hypothetical protein
VAPRLLARHARLRPLLSRPAPRGRRLPNLDRVVADGQQNFLSELPPRGRRVIPCTGQSFGVHGVLDFNDLDARRYDGMAGRYASSTEYADRTVHSVLSRAGWRVASIYLPMTSPPWPVNGMIISGFPLPTNGIPRRIRPGLPRRCRLVSTRSFRALRAVGSDSRHLRFNLQRIRTSPARRATGNATSS